MSPDPIPSPTRSSTAPSERAGLVAGIDGCRTGWVVAVADSRPGTPLIGVEIVTAIEEIVDRVRSGEFAAVAIDMPIGLPDSGTRACDVATRARLGRKGSSVFPAPVRAVLGSADHAEAVRRSRAIDGRGVTIQAFNILAKIEQVDRAFDPALADRIFEAHPESVFATLAGSPLLTKKRLVAGRLERLGILDPVFPDSAGLLSGRLPGAAPDDVLDAAAIAWTAQRWLAGEALVLGDGSVDSLGRPMRVAI